MLIPASGKSSDLNVEDIKTVSDADRVLSWLNAALLDMDTQVRDRADDGDAVWLKRLRAAARNTIYLRHRILEIRDSLSGTATLAEAFTQAALATLDDSTVAVIKSLMYSKHPHLRDLFELESTAT